MIVGKDGCFKMTKATMVPLLENLFQYDDPVLILNTSCNIESISNKAAQILNLDEEIGKPLPMDDLSQSRWNSFLKRIRQEKFSFSSFNIKGKDSAYKEIKVFGMFLKKNNLVFLKILNEDSDNKFQLYRKHFLNDLPYGLLFFKDEMINEINSRAIELLDIDLGNISNLSFDSFLSKYFDYGYKKLQFLSELKAFGHATLEVKRLNRQNEERYLTMNCKYFYYLDMIVVSIVDHTETVKLKQKVKELEHFSEIGKISANITHELKNAVTSLKGFMELLKFNTTEEGKKYIKIIESEMQRMETILSEILYLAKPTKFIKEKVSMLHVIEEVIEIMQPQAYKNHVVIQLKADEECDSMITGNVNHLKQMFINLVKNAIEVMENGGTITIELKNICNKVQVLIQDEGTGIPEENLNKLFTPFFTTKDEGTGLGLSLVKKVVDEHHGKISVESIVDVGSTFILEFPGYTENYTKYYYDENQMKKLLASRTANSVPLV